MQAVHKLSSHTFFLSCDTNGLRLVLYYPAPGMQEGGGFQGAEGEGKLGQEPHLDLGSISQMRHMQVQRLTARAANARPTSRSVLSPRLPQRPGLCLSAPERGQVPGLFSEPQTLPPRVAGPLCSDQLLTCRRRDGSRSGLALPSPALTCC